jgi:hypothetical protein
VPPIRLVRALPLPENLAIHGEDSHGRPDFAIETNLP